MAEPRIAGLELGGTKCVALVGVGREIVARATVPTTSPEETLGRLADRLAGWWDEAPFAALGIGSFGPVGLDSGRPDYGHVTDTPKPGWADADIAGRFAARFAVPIGFDTDVAGAALAERRWGAAADTTCSVYLTIGTGIGGGVLVDGRPLHGLGHPEIGHVRVRREPDDAFAGCCPFHGDCLEGLASGRAIAARGGQPADRLAPGDPLWARVANELAELMAMLVLTLSPQHIALGGGVGIGQPQLLPLIRARTATLLSGYVAGLDATALERLIDHASLGEDAGPLGALALGLEALARG